MRTAIIAVTDGGIKLASQIRRHLTASTDIFCRKQNYLLAETTVLDEIQPHWRIIFIDDWRFATEKIFDA